MVVVSAEAKRWGNSIGVVIPSEVIREQGIKEHSQVQFVILRKGSDTLKRTFGMAKGKLSKSAQQIKDELRDELYD